jgi:hypothetical protein
MKWYVEYMDGKVVDEKTINFNFIDKKGISKIYFNNGSNVYGLDVVGKVFFINNKHFEAKLDGEVLEIIQYKNANYIFQDQQSVINSWNVGFTLNTEEGLEKYILSIESSYKVYLCAYRNLDQENEEFKRIRLK